MAYFQQNNEMHLYKRRDDENNAAGAIKVVWKKTDVETSDQTPPEFFILCNEEELKNYRSDSSIPLVRVVQAFQVWTAKAGGNEGLYEKPSKELLKEYFGTSNIDAVVETIAKTGHAHGLD